MMDYLLLAERSALATVFALAFTGKVRTWSGFQQFIVSVRRLANLPPSVAAVVAVVITISEAATVVLLALPSTVRAGFILASGLLLVFIAVALRGSLSGVTAECRCFGRAAVIGVAMVLRNVLLLAVAASGLLANRAGSGVDPVPAALALVGGCCGAVVFVRYYDVAVQFVGMRVALPPPAESVPPLAPAQEPGA